MVKETQKSREKDQEEGEEEEEEEGEEGELNTIFEDGARISQGVGEPRSIGILFNPRGGHRGGGGTPPTTVEWPTKKLSGRQKEEDGLTST